ncbi:MAG TPA: DUF5801 repeats-in-toxin domain-containing protein [Dongiaceae bacterium]|nr:DUF5801 repeats-in-toxin domain-containing protein [Dongiaceae bacterium]
MPALGHYSYGPAGEGEGEGSGTWVPVTYNPADLTIGLDETPGQQHTNYQADVGTHDKGDIDPDGTFGQHANHYADDANGWAAWNIEHNAETQINTILGANPSDPLVSYQQDVLGNIDSSFFSGGKFCGDAMGAACTKLDVSFGADGKAEGNVQAGQTLFDKDGSANATAFQLYMQVGGGTPSENPPVDKQLTNLTITYQDAEGNVQHLHVYAYQLDANTIIGITEPVNGETQGGGDETPRIASFESENGISGGLPVFELQLDPQTGELTLIQYHQIDNTDPTNPNDPIQILNSDGSELLHFRATDYDGDFVDAPLEAAFIDDAPIARDDYATLDETLPTWLDPDHDPHKVTGNVVLGNSNDLNPFNNTQPDHESVDHPHTITEMKYGDTTIDLDFTKADDAAVKLTGGADASNVHFDSATGVLSFDTPYGHLDIVVKSAEPDPTLADASDKNALGYYEYTGAHNAIDTYYGIPQNGDGSTQLPGGVPDLLASFGGVQLSNNNGDNWSYKQVTVDGKTYTGLGVAGGLDNGETDTKYGQAEQVTLKLPNAVNNATVTLGALFDGVLFDNGHLEVAQWQAIGADGHTVIASGVVTGDHDGLVDIHIETGNQTFSSIVLTPLDDGAGNNGNNSDFLVVGVNTCQQVNVCEQFNYTLTDGDGDSSSANLNINVIDDKPSIPFYGNTSSVTVDEDGLHGGVFNDTSSAPPNEGSGDLRGGHNSSSEAVYNGGVFHYDVGADGFGSLTLNCNSSVQTLDGKNVIFAWDAANMKLIGYEDGDTSKVAIEVTLHPLNGTDYSGGFTFDVQLLEPLKHPGHDADGQNNGPQTEWEDNLKLDIQVQVEDKDCDVATGHIQVTVNDDMPVVSGCWVGNIPTLETQDAQTIGSKSDIDTDSFKFNFQTNVTYGADGPGNTAVSFTLALQGGATQGVDSHLKSQGQEIYLSIDSNGVVHGTINGGATDVFTLSVDGNGNVKLTQFQELDHPSGGPSPDYDDQSVSLGSGLVSLIGKVTATDGDGDSASSSQALDLGGHVKFDDDGPSTPVVHYSEQDGRATSGHVDEDWLAASTNGTDGNHDTDATPGDNTGGTTTGGTYSVDYGADTPGSTSMARLVVTDDKGNTILDTQGANNLKTSDGHAVSLTTTATSIIGYESGHVGDNAYKVFSMVLNNGTWSFTLFEALSHPYHDDPSTNKDNNTVTSFEDNLKFDFSLVSQDFDGDKSQAAHIVVSVDDDGPKAYDDGPYTVTSLNSNNTPELSGNVLTNDHVGADSPGSVVQIKLGNGSWVDVPTVGGKDITATNGVLHINSDGTWTFNQTSNASQGTSLNFTYRMSDADGDTDTAGFTINLKAGQPPSFEASTVTLDEDGLPGGNNPNTSAAQGAGDEVGGHVSGGTPNPASEAIWHNTFTVNWNGDTTSQSITFNKDTLTNLKGLDGNPLHFTGDGTSDLKGYNAQNQLVLEVAAGNASQGEYTVTLYQPVQHPTSSSSEDDVSAKVMVNVSNGSGTTSHEMNITINDDTPTAANDDFHTFVAGPVNAAMAIGNVLTNDHSGADGYGSHAVTGVQGASTDATGFVLTNADGTIHVSYNGEVTFTPADNKDYGNGEDFNFTYTITDGDGDTSSATAHFKMTGGDLAPHNINDSVTVTDTANNANVMIIFDRSGSMGDDPHVSGFQHRIDLARAALDDLLTKYGENGDVRVMIVDFATDASSMGHWGTITEAEAYLNTLSANGNTSYSDAVAQAAASWNLSGKGTDYSNYVYFLSDGVPTVDGDGTSDHHLSSTQKSDWDTFLEGHNISGVYAVGVGSDVSSNDSDLKDVANPDGNPTPTNPPSQVIIASDESTLANQLTSTVQSTVHGNVLDGSLSGGGANADTPGNAPAHVASFSHPSSGQTFTWDGVSGTVIQTNGATTGVTISGTNVTIVTTDGTMIFHFADGTFDYTPKVVDASTTDVFHYVTQDVDGDLGNGADLTINITHVNHAPITVDDEVSTNENVALTINPSTLLANDSDADGDPLTITAVGGATHGTVAIVSGQIVFTPDVNYAGQGSFTYTANDGHGGTTTGNVIVDIAQVNDAPVNTVPGAQTTAEDTSLTISGLSIADVDAGSGSMTVTLSVAHGSISVNTAGSGASASNNGTGTVTLTGTVAQIDAALGGTHVTYTPTGNYNGSDTLTMTTNDNGHTGGGGSKTDTDTVAITVTPVNDAPVNTVPGAQTASAGTEKSITGLSISDVDAGSGPMTVTLSVAHGVINVTGSGVTNNGTGTVTINGTLSQINTILGTVKYTATSGYNGSDTLTINTNDNGNTGAGGAKSDQDTVAIAVTVPNIPPVAGADSIITNVSTSFTVQDAWLLANDTDANNDPLSIAAVAAAAGESTYFQNGTPSHGSGAVTIDLDTGSGSGKLGNGDSTALNYTLSDTHTTVTGSADVHYYTGTTLTGTAAHEIIVGGNGGNTIDGHGGNDVIVSGSGDDKITYHAGDHVDGGSNSSNDLGSNSYLGDVLDVSQIAGTVNIHANIANLAHIETINATGGGNQAVILQASDVISMSDATFNPSGSSLPTVVAMKVEGNAGDTLKLDDSSGQWHNITGSISNEPSGHAVYAFDSNGGPLDGGHVTAYVIVSTNVTVTDHNGNTIGA